MDTTLFNAQDDLSALAWVHAELRRSLEAAHKSLRRHVREAPAADDPAAGPDPLQGAVVLLHQSAGALEVVGQPAAARVLGVAEAAARRLSRPAAPADDATVEAIERASFAVIDFIARQLAGRAVSPVAMFPQYRALAPLGGLEGVHPADLWAPAGPWEDLPADGTVTPREPDDAARGEMEALVLALMRRPEPAALRAASDLCAALGAGADGAPATLWRLAAAFFEAQGAGLLVADVHGKRVASRLLSALRAASRGLAELPPRLLHDLRFFAAHAREPASPLDAPRLHAVRRAWAIDGRDAVDYETPSLGRVDPALVSQARTRVAAAREAWADLAAGEGHRRAGLPEHFSRLEDAVQRLFPGGPRLAEALREAATEALSAPDEVPPALAMEVATALLYIDAAVDDGEFDHPDEAARIARLAGRIDDARTGADPGPVDGWMEELYRRVSDRQSLGGVVHALGVSLATVEKDLDTFLRDAADREALQAVPAHLDSVRGVFAMLGLDAAARAAQRLRDDVLALADPGFDPLQGPGRDVAGRLVDNLGALGLLVDMMGVQPKAARALFGFDPESGRLSPLRGRQGHAVDGQREPEAGPARAAAADRADASVALPNRGAGLDDDAEMRAMFVDEARQILSAAQNAL